MKHLFGYVLSHSMEISSLRKIKSVRPSNPKNWGPRVKSSLRYLFSKAKILKKSILRYILPHCIISPCALTFNSLDWVIKHSVWSTKTVAMNKMATKTATAWIFAMGLGGCFLQNSALLESPFNWRDNVGPSAWEKQSSFIFIHLQKMIYLCTHYRLIQAEGVD